MRTPSSSWFAVLFGSMSLAAWAACSDSGSAAPSAHDAGSDVSSYDAAVDVPDAGEVDAGPDVAPDPCAVDAGEIFPTDLACTGLYSDMATKTIAPGVRPYAVPLVFWSDNAEKSRWLYLPPGTKIDSSDMDEWVFPEGTRVWKEFRLAGRRIETRLYAKINGQWFPTIYRWSDDEKSARKMEGGDQVDAGGVPYTVPDNNACEQCHAGHKDKLLGVEAINLGLPGATGMTLASLVSEGLLTVPPASTTTTMPEDATGKAAAALGWLHVQCGVTCHNARGTAAFTGLRMRVATRSIDGGALETVQDTATWNTAVGQLVASPAYRTGTFAAYTHRIAPGNLSDSLIPAVAGTRGTGQMPPIVTHVVDDVGLQKVKDWISALPP